MTMPRNSKNLPTQADKPISRDEGIVLIGNDSDPLYHWFHSRLSQFGYDVGLWCLDDPASQDLDLMPPEGSLVINTVLEKPGFALNSYLVASKMEGFSKPRYILQNILAETLLQVQVGIEDDYHWVGYSAFGLYGRLGQPQLPAIETTQNIPEPIHQFLAEIQMPVVSVPACPSLITGRIVAMLVNEACSALMENVASAEAIDTAMQKGTNYPMGPLTWADAAGLDVILTVLNHLYALYKEPRYRPMRLLQEYVLSGRLGQKTGQGFYTYPQPVAS